MHQLELAKEFFPRLIGLKEGAVLFDDSTGDLSKGDVDSLYQLEEGIS